MRTIHTLKRMLPAGARSFVKQLLISAKNYIADIPQPQIKPLIEKYCLGNGIEIGPGKKPYCDPARTVFLDKYTGNKDACVNPDVVSDASAIPFADGNFSFLFSAHCLEHCPNTLRTLYEWERVLKPGGVLFLILPHADRTFDKYRARTTLEHHIRDYETLSDKPDYSHNEEIKEGWSKNPDFELQKNKYEQDWGAKVWDFEFRIRNGVMHYHVWTQDEIIKVLQYAGMEILYVAERLPERDDSFLIIARKNSQAGK